jgi:microcystin-dependent protein
MSEPYVGEIRLYPYPRGAPQGWHNCDGSLLAISEYEVLFTLLGTAYGGDGMTSFALPDLRGRVPIHQGTGPGLSTYILGEVSGSETVTLSINQMPRHIHMVMASTQAASTSSPSNVLLAAAFPNDGFYASTVTGATSANLIASAVGPDGNNQPHENCAPTLTLNYCIALYGIYPSQS